MDTYSEEWKRICLARSMVRTRNPRSLEQFLVGWGKKRGAQAERKMRDLVIQAQEQAVQGEVAEQKAHVQCDMDALRRLAE